MLKIYEKIFSGVVWGPPKPPKLQKRGFWGPPKNIFRQFSTSYYFLRPLVIPKQVFFFF